MRLQVQKPIIMTSLLLGLTACGGGGGSSNNSNSASTPVQAVPTAADCLGPLVGVTGTTTVENTNTLDSTGAVVQTMTATKQFKGWTTFNGQSAFDVNITNHYSLPAGKPDETEDGYVQYDLANKRIMSLGSVLTIAGYKGSETTTYSPASLTRYDLAVGDSYTNTGTETITYPTSSTAATTLTNNTTETSTFVGEEQVTVPAGTFTACKYMVNGDSTGSQVDTVTMTRWVSKGTGLLLKAAINDSVKGVHTIELTGATINGAPLQP